jgi:APA family basic amino acid/polyamine antiporter
METRTEGRTELRRALGPLALVMLGIGAVIGTGIFTLTGQAAALHAGPAIVLSMVIAGVAAGLAGVCYAELATMFPVAGSAYSYARAAFGPLCGWVIGWDLVLEYALSVATVAVGWSGNLRVLLRDAGIELAPGRVDVLAMLAVVAVTLLLVRGVKESAAVNTAIVAIKVAVILIVIGCGALFLRPALWQPFVPPNTGEFGSFGWSGVLRGAAVIFFAYIGFDAVSTAAQESKRPQRDMPIGLLGSLGICTVLYVLVSGVMVGLAPYAELNSPAPMALAADAARERAAGSALSPLVNSLSLLVKLGTFLGLSSTMVVTLLGQTRVFYAMAQDGMLPAWTARIHPRFRTPHLATLVTGGACAIVAGLTPIGVLGQLVSIGTLFAFALVSVGVLVLRRKLPDAPRPFRVPLAPWIPLAAALVSVALMAGLPLATWERLGIWMALGVGIYAMRRARPRGALRSS